MVAAALMAAQHLLSGGVWFNISFHGAFADQLVEAKNCYRSVDGLSTPRMCDSN